MGEDDKIDGEATLNLLLRAKNPLKTITASLKSSKVNGRDHFMVKINSGKETTEISGNMVAPNFPTAEGEISITSTMAKSKLPIKLKFNQVLTLERYHGDYNITYPEFVKASKNWV